MIAIIDITLPDSVTVGASFIIKVEVLEFANEYICYCGTFNCGQEIILP